MLHAHVAIIVVTLFSIVLIMASFAVVIAMLILIACLLLLSFIVRVAFAQIHEIYDFIRSVGIEVPTTYFVFVLPHCHE